MHVRHSPLIGTSAPSAHGQCTLHAAHRSALGASLGAVVCVCACVCQAFDKGLMEYGMMTAVKAPLSAPLGSAEEGQQAGKDIKVLVAA